MEAEHSLAVAGAHTLLETKASRSDGPEAIIILILMITINII